MTNTKSETSEKFLKWIANNYDQLKSKYSKFCYNKHYVFDEDIFADLPIKVYELIQKKGISDATDSGFDNYCFKAFKNNLLNEKRYSRVNKRDSNKSDAEINELYESWYNVNKVSSNEKVMRDLWIDFSTLYILLLVEANFDSEHFYLFKIKTLCGLTFKQLQEQTQIPYSRKKFLEVQNWLKVNLKKSDVKRAFDENFGDFLA